MTAVTRLDGVEIPHLSGPAALVRQVIAAHFLADCEHVVEIGGHLRPVTSFLTHGPRSVLVVDPKVVPYEAEELNGRPCRVRHVARKFQEVSSDFAPGTYGLVLLGYSLKPFGKREPLGELLFGLIDNARVTVIEYPPALDRAASQVPSIIARPSTRVRCKIGLSLHDPEIAGSPYADRLLYVLDPAEGVRPA